MPLLFAGQAQKEFFVNQALTIIDTLFSRAVTGSLAAPPAAPADGQIFRVTVLAQGEWSGHADDLAVRVSNVWHFIRPHEGLQLFDIAAGQSLIYREGWVAAAQPLAATGGAVIDVEARASLAALIASLSEIGVLGPAGS
jgi:hypothetical protein